MSKDKKYPFLTKKNDADSKPSRDRKPARSDDRPRREKSDDRSSSRPKKELPFLKKESDDRPKSFEKFIKRKQTKDDKLAESLDNKTKKKLQRQIERDQLYKDKSDKSKAPREKKLFPPVEQPKKEAPAPAKPEGSGILRLNKYIAKSGLCSRRNAAELVKDGQIKVNGEVHTNPAYVIQEGDVVTYEDKVVKPVEKMVYYLMNKPKNTITTTDDEKGRRTVMDVLGDRVKEKVYPVGRLDRNTTGLLLFTNDGDLANKLSHPNFKMKKIYHATLDKEISAEDIEQIRQGLTLEDGPAPVNKVSLLEEDDATRVGVDIHIGRNRIVRRIFEHLGYQVEKLDRVYYAGLTKKDLPKGFVRSLEQQEVIMLKHFTPGK